MNHLIKTTAFSCPHNEHAVFQSLRLCLLADGRPRKACNFNRIGGCRRVPLNANPSADRNTLTILVMMGSREMSIRLDKFVSNWHHEITPQAKLAVEKSEHAFVRTDALPEKWKPRNAAIR
jgi:hypothetical protein